MSCHAQNQVTTSCSRIILKIDEIIQLSDINHQTEEVSYLTCRANAVKLHFHTGTTTASHTRYFQHTLIQFRWFIFPTQFFCLQQTYH